MSATGDRRRRRGSGWQQALVWLLALVALLPFAQMIWLAQKPRARVNESCLYLSRLLPEREVRRKVEIPARPLRVALVNSAVVSSACALFGVLLCSLAGYAFAKKRFPGKAALFDLVLASMAVPVAILMMPMFRVTVALGIYDTLLALILPCSVTGFGIFFMRYAISAVPDGVIEAGRLDGLSEAGTVFRVVLPMVWPSVVTLAVIQFITSWGAFVVPHAVIASKGNYTVGILLGRLMSDFQGLMWNDVMIVVIAAAVPPLVAFAAFHPWVLRGLTALGDRRAA